METFIGGVAFVVDYGLRHLVAALGERLELTARYERPLEALAQERRRADHERTVRKDFERAWRTY